MTKKRYYMIFNQMAFGKQNLTQGIQVGDVVSAHLVSSNDSLDGQMVLDFLGRDASWGRRRGSDASGDGQGPGGGNGGRSDVGGPGSSTCFHLAKVRKTNAMMA